MTLSKKAFGQTTFRPNDHLSKKAFGRMTFRSNEISIKSFFIFKFRSNDRPFGKNFFRSNHFSFLSFGQMTDLSVKISFGQMTFFGKMPFESNGVRSNGVSVKRTRTKGAMSMTFLSQNLHNSLYVCLPKT
jgi:hypothetical protein